MGQFVLMYLALQRSYPRFLRAVLAAASVAILGLIAASPAAAAPRACPFISRNGRYALGDPVATYSDLGGNYTQEPGLAYKLTGRFPHATTYSFTAYDDYGFIPGSPGVAPAPAPTRAYTLNDFQITPDPGSVNPFRSGNLINARNRNYTVWVWPDSVPVPSGLKNVVLFPTTPADPSDKLIRWIVLLRQYLMQPGYSAQRSLPTVQVVRTSDPKVVIPCPASITTTATAGAFSQSFDAQLRTFVAGTRAAAPRKSNQLYFTRAPAQFVGFGVGVPADGAIDYLGAPLDLSKITVITIHRTPLFFDNQHLTGKAIMRKYQVRYMSVVSESSPVTAALPDTSAIFERNGAWVTVMLPSDPRLSPSREREIRAKATKLRYNVLQDPTPNRYRLGSPTISIREFTVSSHFCCEVTQVPSWTNPHNPATAHNNYRDWPQQTSPEFFAKYASNPRDMGPYWVGGVRESFSDFMRH